MAERRLIVISLALKTCLLLPRALKLLHFWKAADLQPWQRSLSVGISLCYTRLDTRLSEPEKISVSSVPFHPFFRNLNLFNIQSLVSQKYQRPGWVPACNKLLSKVQLSPSCRFDGIKSWLQELFDQRSSWKLYRLHLWVAVSSSSQSGILLCPWHHSACIQHAHLKPNSQVPHKPAFCLKPWGYFDI